MMRQFVLPTGWLLYHQKVRSTKMFVHDVTPITPLPLLFFGGDIQWGLDGDQEVVTIDDFIVFRCPVRVHVRRCGAFC